MMKMRLTCLLALAATLPAFGGALTGSGEEAVSAAPQDVKGVSTAAITGQPIAEQGPVVLTASTTRTWRVESSDVRLSTTLERWAKASGYNLIWDAQKQVLLSAKDSFDGTLEQALVRVLSSPAIRKSEYPLEACFYPNQPPVIRITRLGEQAEECPK